MSKALDDASRRYWRNRFIGGWAFQGACLLAIAMFAYPTILTIQTISWPKVAGHLVSAQEYRTRGAPRQGRRQKLNVDYTYEVDGVEYADDRASWFGDLAVSREWFTESVVSADGRLWVYYDPDDPSRSVLVRGFGANLRVLMWAVVAFIALANLIGVWAIWSARRGVRLQRPVPERHRRFFERR